MLQEDHARFLQWLCLSLAHCCEPFITITQFQRHGIRVFSILPWFPPCHLPLSIIPVPALGLQPSGFVIFSTLDQLAFPCDIRQPGLLGDWPACYFKVPSQHAALFGLGRSWGLARHPCQWKAGHASHFGGGPRGVCAVASGLLLSVICGLHRGPWGGRLGFPWVPRGSGVCLGSWGGRCTLGTSLFSGCHGRGRGPFRQRGRAPDTPTRLRAAASLKWQEWIFQDTCHMLRGPRQEKFP